MILKSTNYAEKLLAIRLAEGMTQELFSLSTDIALNVIKGYETEGEIYDPTVIEKLILLDKDRYRKYILWLAIGQVAYEAGQIDPALSRCGPEIITLYL
ncbi:transcriptional regulator [Limnobaculum zhutongyuii]|uniref:Transcriptional regulator n=1 Tax=Limnobaculum zhutongyuii TaxID=2498113 RepID=A0A411WMK2_9GAMM|nr:transcriptional regulator [Limnobaculum zhutongyuii]QBH97370.1 transcriptional regulator [Limnobaculum zhutongyuii]TQS90844.1 transcriptional regulator [Limnobaculum zhutongyuii]